MAGKPITAVCTMATRECVAELVLFHRSLRALHPTLPVFLGCTTDVQRAVADARTASPLREDAYVRWVPCLDPYGPVISRKAMERQLGVWYPARHTDFMMEKANLMELALTSASASVAPAVAFLDCDITLLHALPTLPAAAAVALSPHAIRAADEDAFGAYNGGYVVACTPEVLWEWRRATHSSRFFDQASLEHVADVFERRAQLHRLPPQHNYGFWRLLQPRAGSVVDEARRFSIAEGGIHYDGAPLCSLHTHFFLPDPPADVQLFNTLMRRWIARCAGASLAYQHVAAALSCEAAALAPQH